MAEATDDQPEVLVLPVRYLDTDQHPVYLANHVALQRHQDGLLLTIGQATPPLILRGDDARLQRLKALPEVSARTLVRVALTPQRAQELATLLLSILARSGSERAEG